MLKSNLIFDFRGRSNLGASALPAQIRPLPRPGAAEKCGSSADAPIIQIIGHFFAYTCQLKQLVFDENVVLAFG
jgi:hypothetical protein